MFGGFQDLSNAFLVLRYEENGSLFDLMKRTQKLPIDFAQSVITEVSIGLNFLHERKIIHGDQIFSSFVLFGYAVSEAEAI